MGGYTIKVSETESAADALSSLKSCATAADSDLQGIAMPAPAAGEGIGGQVTAMLAAWHKALPDIGNDLDVLGKNVRQAASVTIQVEEQLHNRYQAFAE